MRAAAWTPRSGEGSRGTILILQGRAEFIEKYFETVVDLRSRGFAVIAFDWRGQGGSGRFLPRRSIGHVASFDDFRHDYESVRRHFRGFVPGPTLVLAHSMGGCIALAGCRDSWLDADRLVLSSPMVGLSLLKRPALARQIARFLAWAGLGTRIVPGGHLRSISTLPFEGNRLSSDRGRYERNAAVAHALDWRAIGSPTIGWLRAAYEAMDKLAEPGAPAAIRIPTLVVAGSEDPICSTPAIELFAGALPSGRLVIVPGARHEVLMEADPLRQRFWDAFDAFTAEAAPTGPARSAPAKVPS